MKQKLVEVTWLDAASYQGRFSRSKYLGIVQRSAGYLIEDSKQGIILGQITDHDERDPTYRNCEEIPRAYVKKVRVLR